MSIENIFTLVIFLLHFISAFYKMSIMAKKTMLYYLEHGDRKTMDIEVAKQVAVKTGKPPAQYLSDKVRDLVLRLYPELKKPIKKAS